MSTQMQLRGGTTSENLLFTGAQREITIDTDRHTINVHDGVTAGGFPTAASSQITNGTYFYNDDTAGGSAANAYLLVAKTNTNVPTAYADGIIFGFTTNNPNTGPSTASFAGLGVKNLKYRGGIDPAPGDINGRVTLIYNAATNWLEIQQKAIGPTPQLRTITASVSGNALIAGIPPCTIDFRAPAQGSGVINSRTISAPLSITAPSGATLGTTSANSGRIVVLAVDNAGAVSVALVNQTSTMNFDETTLINTVAISSSSTSANTVYGVATASGLPFRVMGFIDSTQPTAGVWTTTPSQIQGQGGQTIVGLPKIAMAVAQSTTSGTAIDFTGIPSWAKRITIMLGGVSTNGTASPQIQIGTSAGIDATAYTGSVTVANAVSVNGNLFTTGFTIVNSAGASAAAIASGTLVLNNISGNTWICTGIVGRSDTVYISQIGGQKTLPGVLDRVRLGTVTGTDSFDLGSVNIMYEG
jgi:hypothetical protein